MIDVTRLDNLMFERELTPINLANNIGIDATTITRYLNDKRSPSVETLVKLTDYFNCSCDYLLGRIDEDYIAAFQQCPPFAEQLRFLKEHFKCS